jgi:tetratricopeptide (TPR) repeat protein
MHWALLGVTLAGAVGVRAATDGRFEMYAPRNAVQWVRSPEAMRRLSLGFDSLLADVYWIRAVQYYGGTRLSDEGDNGFDLLFPLLDITTSLDPRFNIAYRFGAILLSEAYPNGPGRPDQAIALLEKGIAEAPDRWEYPYDAGFVHYWWARDYEAAGDWFLRAAERPGAPEWLEPFAASILARGGTREAAREMWLRLAETSEHQWVRDNARRSLQQLAALEVIEQQLQPVVNAYDDRTGAFPASWGDVVRAGLLPGVPLDPTGAAYGLDPVSGIVDIGAESDLYPLPAGLR